MIHSTGCTPVESIPGFSLTGHRLDDAAFGAAGALQTNLKEPEVDDNVMSVADDMPASV